MKRLLMATALASVFAGPAMAANVALTMWTDGSDAVTESGTIGFTVGNENLDGVTVDTTFALRGITSKQLTEGNVNIDNTTGSIQTLHLIVGASGFGGPDSAFKLTGSILNASGANSLSGGYFIDPTNTLNGLGMSVVGTQIGSFASGVLGDAESFSFNGVGVFAVLGNYGMAEQLTLTLAPGAEVGIQGISMVATSGVPEPSTWVMMGGGFALLAALGLRRRKTARFAV